MTLERLAALKNVPENQDPERQRAIGKMRDIFVSAGLEDIVSGDVSPEAPKIYPEISLEVLKAEIERQAGKYQELGFPGHKGLRVSEGKFKDSVMKLAVPQPENFKGRFNTPMIVFGQISAREINVSLQVLIIFWAD